MMILALLLSVASAQFTGRPFPLTFSGDAENDFPERGPMQSDWDTKRYPIVVEVDANFLDVGTPPGWDFDESGWDMKDLRFAYDYDLDQFHMAINCFGVCGDADGDGFPSGTSAQLNQRGGQDLENFQSSESCAVAFDVGDASRNTAEPDGSFDFVVGYPAETPDGSEEFPCGSTSFDTACFGLYRYLKTTGVEQLGQRFVYQSANAQEFQFAKDRNPVTSRARPDLEWSVENFNQVRQFAGVPAIDSEGIRPFSMNVAAFCGSFQDDGVGEDTFPNDADFKRVDWPCFRFDVCGVCGGDGTTCGDCLGIPNGPNEYDECDICAGDGGRDCAGVPCGPSVYDVCDVCGGNGDTCLDCQGVPNGPAVYDTCDVCNGNDFRDCTGTCGGPAVYDCCDVCNGDGQSCVDCTGVCNGPSVYDICDVCNGDNSSCLEDPLPRNPCTPRDPHVCQMHPGDTFTMTLGDAEEVAPRMRGKTVSMCVAELGFMAVSGDAGTIFQRWSEQKDGAFIIDDFSAIPQESAACQNGLSGRYNLVWDEHCSMAQLVQREDSCTSRRAMYTGVTLHRKKCRDDDTKIYEVGPRTVWTGMDEDNNRVWLNFCRHGAYIETRGEWEDANTIFGVASFGEGVVTFTEVDSFPRTVDTPDQRGAACAGQLADYDLRYAFLPDSSDSYWSDRPGHTSVSSISSDDDDDDTHPYGQYREHIEGQAYYHTSTSSSSDSSSSSSSSSDTNGSEEDDDTDTSSSSSSFRIADIASTTSSTTSSSSSSSSSSTSSSDDDDDGYSSLYLRRKRNNVNSYVANRGVVTLQTARIYGRVKDRCEERSALFTGLTLYELDMCNGELPHECFPEKPPCDSSSETVDGTTSDTSSESSWCTSVSKSTRSSSSSSSSDTTVAEISTTSSSTSSSNDDDDTGDNDDDDSSSDSSSSSSTNSGDDDDDSSNYGSSGEETSSLDKWHQRIEKILETSSSSSDDDDSYLKC